MIFTIGRIILKLHQLEIQLFKNSQSFQSFVASRQTHYQELLEGKFIAEDQLEAKRLSGVLDTRVKIIPVEWKITKQSFIQEFSRNKV